ncbi:MAG: hypothetical protein ACRDCB_09700 [Clostridium sp.]|uniref:hypothetical protein n=1 Tax=Clostridium sp. LY3-2 TaxID=2942482 RepID=UPI00215266DB|nr:hypothetical protein [Clostridium sp. LY3-2]MCR6515521.1 hypothetical protein [Clostridium sp. LY3-2]
MKTKKILLGGIITLAILALIILGVYNFSFKPKETVDSINKTVTIDPIKLSKKFLPKDINLSLEELTAESNTKFNSNEITDLFIEAINEMPDLKNSLSGIKVSLDNDLINVYANINYYNIPFQLKLVFSAKAVDGKGILHYESGNLGFISISKDTIFNNLENNSLITFDKNSGDIILSLEGLDNIDIKDMKVQDGDLVINFRGTIKFWDWLKK